MVKPLSWIAIALAVALMLASMLLTVSSGSATEMGGDQPTGTVASTATPTRCPVPTQALLYVDPVTSPTDQFSQVISIRFRGEWVEVSAESGTFREEDARGPWEIKVDLLPNIVHHLLVTGYVPDRSGCVYPTHFYTSRDRNGAPLIIEQVFEPDHFYYLPLIHRDSGELPNLIGYGGSSVVLRREHGQCIFGAVVYVSNDGEGPAGHFVVRNDARTFEWEIDTLAAGAVHHLAHEDGVSGRTWVDADNEVVESDEGNNEVRFVIATAPPDCFVTPMGTPTPASTPTVQR